MKTRTKALLLALSAVLLVVSTVMATMAFLTSTTDVVKNTFTVGNVQIKLDESNEGTPDDTTDRTTKGNEYHLLPGHTYVKDPTVTVVGGSENCYVRMFVVVNNITELKAAFDETYIGSDGNTFLLQNLVDWNTNWEYVSCTEDATADTATYEFRYNEMVAKKSNDTKMDALFTEITIPGSIDNAKLALLQSVSIDVYANAIQADGFANAAAAWAAWTGPNFTTPETTETPNS